MRRISRHYKKLRYAHIKAAMIVVAINILFLPSFVKFQKDENNLRHIFLNGQEVGCLGHEGDERMILADARRKLAKDASDVVFANGVLSVETSTVVFAKIDSKEAVEARMTEVLSKSIVSDKKHAYTMKIGDYMVNLAGSDEVREVLQAAVDVYDTKGQFAVNLQRDSSRELNALTASVVTTKEAEEIKEEEPVRSAGFETLMERALVEADLSDDEKSFDDYVYGIESLAYGNPIEVVDAYLTEDQITDVAKATDDVITVQEKDAIYEVQSGDTLSEIAEKTNIPMDKIISLNENLESETSMIRVGDELVITMPEPPLSVERVEQEYIEEYYDAPIEYILNDEWYTTDQVTHQQPSAGRRNIVAQISYRNDKEVSREIIKEEVLLEAVPKIVEKGTKIPPTYIKPISGGRMSSGFGGRRAPTKGASTNHKGIDWATPVGTAVYASCGGTVVKAGWGSGYGNVVYIRHPDGRETRYGHLSKCLVSAGQQVSQGQKIALSGNTGRSTGPHLHFEIRINGAAVNPLKYLN